LVIGNRLVSKAREEKTMYSFDIERPSTVAEAVAALGKDEAQALGGGQTLIPTLKQRLASPETLVSLTGIAEMKGVCAEDGAVSIGGGTNHATVAAEASA
jgi:carbon-monoxide dehydrogenase medium subunit